MLDESLKAGWGRLSEMVKLDCRERDRSSGKLHSVEKEAELIEAARLVDGELGRPELVIRNLDVFFFGDMKRHWFARKGEGYDILEDENIMISPACRWSIFSCRRGSGRGRGGIQGLGRIWRGSWTCLSPGVIRTMISGIICVRRKMNEYLSWSFV